MAMSLFEFRARVSLVSHDLTLLNYRQEILSSETPSLSVSSVWFLRRFCFLEMLKPQNEIGF